MHDLEDFSLTRIRGDSLFYWPYYFMTLQKKFKGEKMVISPEPLGRKEKEKCSGFRQIKLKFFLKIGKMTKKVIDKFTKKTLALKVLTFIVVFYCPKRLDLQPHC